MIIFWFKQNYMLIHFNNFLFCHFIILCHVNHFSIFCFRAKWTVDSVEENGMPLLKQNSTADKSVAPTDLSNNLNKLSTTDKIKYENFQGQMICFYFYDTYTKQCNI